MLIPGFLLEAVYHPHDEQILSSIIIIIIIIVIIIIRRLIIEESKQVEVDISEDRSLGLFDGSMN